MPTQSKPTLVYGLGTSGCAAVNFLLKRGRKVIAYDDRDTPQLVELAERLKQSGAEVVLGGTAPLEVGEVVTSPGVGPEVLAPYRSDKIRVISELELGCREVSVPIIAVTGTNGKSTVVTNIAHGLKMAGYRSAAVGNLGIPVCEWVDSNEPLDFLVIEVSSYQLENIDSFKPHVAVVLNVAPDHLGRYPGMKEYIAAKAQITRNQTIDDALVLNKNLADVGALQRTRGRLYWYGKDLGQSLDGLSLNGGLLTWSGNHPTWSTHVEYQGLFDHEIENLLAVLTSLLLVGCDIEKVLPIFEQFQRLPHRLERIELPHNVLAINDSKATNVHAALAGLRAMDRPVVWLLGGQGKNEDLTPLAQAAREMGVRQVVCFGQDAQQFAQALKNACPVSSEASLRDATGKAVRLAQEGECILLSPATASFDEFTSFEDRGDKFRGWVKEFANGGAE